MAADYVKVTKTMQLGNLLVSAADRLRELRELVAKLNAVGQHCFSASDYSVLEVQFGLVPGQGANVLTLIGLVNTILNTATDVTGATRLAQLDEFTARLAGQ